MIDREKLLSELQERAEEYGYLRDLVAADVGKTDEPDPVPDPEPEPDPDPVPDPEYPETAELRVEVADGLLHAYVATSANLPCTTLYRLIDAEPDDIPHSFPVEDSYQYGLEITHHQRTDIPAPGTYEFWSFDHIGDTYRSNTVTLTISDSDDNSEPTEPKKPIDDSLLAEFDPLVTQALKNLTADYQRVDGRLTSQSGYQSWTTLTAIMLMQEHYPSDERLQAGVDYTLEFIASGRDLVGKSQEGFVYTIDGYNDWYAAPNNVVPAQAHYDWRQSAALSNLLYSIVKHGFKPKQADAISTIHEHLKTMWDKWRYGKPSESSNIRYVSHGEGFARLAQLAMALDYLDDDTGNNEWSEYVNNYRFREFTILLDNWLDSDRSTPFPHWYHKETPVSKTVDTSHANDLIQFYTLALRRGYTMQGALTSEFIDKLCLFVWDTMWPTTQQDFASDTSGATTDTYWASFIHGWVMLSANDSALRQRFRDYIVKGPNILPRMDWWPDSRAHYIAALTDAELGGPVGRKDSGPAVEPEEPAPKKGLRMISPAPGFVADSPHVDFAWLDDTDPDKIKVYDLHIYYDEARTRKVTGTDGVLFDTQSIKTATSHTFRNDPSDGGKRYGVLWQWPDENSYRDDVREEILFEYTAFKRESTTPDLGDDFKRIRAMVDGIWPEIENSYTSKTLQSNDGYFASPILHAAALMSRTTGERRYLDVGIRIGQAYIDSGRDFDDDGFLDWMNDDGDVVDYNKDHHEFRTAMGLGSVLIEMARTGYTNGDASRIEKWASFLAKHHWQKWTHPTAGRLTSNTNRYTTSIQGGRGTWFMGRNAVVALALDYTHATPGNNEYHEWLTSPSSSVGMTMATYIKLIKAGDYRWPAWDNDGSDYASDTSHISDALFPFLFGRVVGFEFSGSDDVFFACLEKHFNHNWFKDSKGFTERSNGAGLVNSYNLSSMHAIPLAAALSPELEARFVDFFLNNKPVGGFHENPVKRLPEASVQGASLLCALQKRRNA